jgi:hypothetical protein
MILIEGDNKANADNRGNIFDPKVQIVQQFSQRILKSHGNVIRTIRTPSIIEHCRLLSAIARAV